MAALTFAWKRQNTELERTQARHQCGIAQCHNDRDYRISETLAVRSGPVHCVRVLGLRQKWHPHDATR
jgi:hypothetical protein